MKKVKYSLVIVIIIIVIFGVIRFYSVSKHVEEINKSLYFSNIDAIPISYFEKNGEFSKSLNQVYSYTVEEGDNEGPEHSKAFFQGIYEDPFSDSLLVYIPVKDSSTQKYLGFVLLSRGPDKEVDNKITVLQSNNYLNQLILLNPSSDIINSFQEIKLSFFDKIGFGKGDILVLYWSMPYYYSQMAKLHPMDIDTIFNKIMTSNYHPNPKKPPQWWLTKEYLPLLLNTGSIRYSKNEIVYPYFEYTFKCQLISAYDPEQFKDQLILVGFLYDVDTTNKIIKFKNCLIQKN